VLDCPCSSLTDGTDGTDGDGADFEAAMKTIMGSPARPRPSEAASHAAVGRSPGRGDLPTISIMSPLKPGDDAQLAPASPAAAAAAASVVMGATQSITSSFEVGDGTRAPPAPAAAASVVVAAVGAPASGGGGGGAPSTSSVGALPSGGGGGLRTSVLDAQVTRSSMEAASSTELVAPAPPAPPPAVHPAPAHSAPTPAATAQAALHPDVDTHFLRKDGGNQPAVMNSIAGLSAGAHTRPLLSSS